MSSDDYDSPADIQAETCENEHDHYDDTCPHCQYRRTLTWCGNCGATHENGQWFTANMSTAPNGCDHTALVDDWGNDLTCPVLELGARCGDPVEHASNTACDHHQRILDAEECQRIYQRLVAVRHAS